MFICNLITPVAGATKAEAEDKMALIDKLPLEIDALSLLAEALNFDFASKGIDEPLTTEELQGMQGMLGIRDGVLKTSAARPIRARAISSPSAAAARPQDAIVGGPKEIADRLEEMFVDRGCDGFVVAATYVPGSYADFVTHVVPELQRRGLFHKDYAGKTLARESRPAAPGGRRLENPAAGRGRIRRINRMRWLKFTAAGQDVLGHRRGRQGHRRQRRSVRRMAAHAQSHALKDVKIELPLMPRTFYCVGLNYLKHLKEAADKARRGARTFRTGPRSAIARRTR